MAAQKVEEADWAENGERNTKTTKRTLPRVNPNRSVTPARARTKFKAIRVRFEIFDSLLRRVRCPFEDLLEWLLSWAWLHEKVDGFEVQ